MGFYARLGQRLRAYRLRAGLSQAALGARLGRSASAIDRYEMGQRRISIADLHRLARVLDVPPTSFFESPAVRAPSGAAQARGGPGRPAQDPLRAEYVRLLRELDRRLAYPPPESRPAVAQEAPRTYLGRRGRQATPVSADEHAAALPPARLRAWARRAGWPGEPDPEILRRYAALVLRDFARHSGSGARRRRTREESGATGRHPTPSRHSSEHR